MRKVVAMSLFDFFKKKEVSKAKSDGSDLLNKIQDNAFPIEKGISGKMPTCDSLYPHEVLVLSYASYYCTSGNKFPKFWSYEYGIKDVQSILSKLEKDGFIEIDSSANRLTKKKISELKPVLQSHGLKASEKKSEMIERILENISEEELDILFLINHTNIQKGEALLKKFEWILIYIIIELMVWIYGLLQKKYKHLPIETIVIKSGNISMKNVSSILRVEILDFIEMLN